MPAGRPHILFYRPRAGRSLLRGQTRQVKAAPTKRAGRIGFGGLASVGPLRLRAKAGAGLPPPSLTKRGGLLVVGGRVAGAGDASRRAPAQVSHAAPDAIAEGGVGDRPRAAGDVKEPGIHSPVRSGRALRLRAASVPPSPSCPCLSLRSRAGNFPPPPKAQCVSSLRKKQGYTASLRALAFFSETSRGFHYWGRGKCGSELLKVGVGVSSLGVWPVSKGPAASPPSAAGVSAVGVGVSRRASALRARTRERPKPGCGALA